MRFTQAVNFLGSFLLLSISPSLFGSVQTEPEYSPSSRLKSINGAYRFTFDESTLPAKEKMGLFGANYLVYRGGWNYGLGIYSAVTGDRGGFFTGGLELGYEYAFLSSWAIGGGYFIGGGGGGGAPQGGGLMLRAHIELMYRANSFSTGLGWSQIDFPNGEIESRQLTFNVNFPFTQLVLSGPNGSFSEIHRRSLAEHSGLAKRTRIFTSQFLAYVPPADHTGRSGKPLDETMHVVGIRWRENLARRWWGEFETGGAWGGGIDGFAQVFLGASYRVPVTRFSALYAGGLFGAAGGGDVDTGGGLLSRGFAGVEIQTPANWLVEIEGGWTQSFSGSFSSAVLSAGVGRRYETLKVGRLASLLDNDTFQLAPFRFRSYVQRYSHYIGNGRKDAGLSEQPIDLVGLNIDAFLNGNFFVTGQALAAYDGDAGGYAVGLVGPGAQIRIAHRVVSGAELLLGAAGGGGVASGSGFIVQPMLNFAVNLTRAMGLYYATGIIHAPNGNLTAWVNNIGLSYDFSVLHGKQ